VQGLALLGLSAANANVILTYIGNAFTAILPPGPPNPYTSTDKVTASITLANPLGNNLNSASVTPPGFSVSDGVQTISDATSVNAALDVMDTTGALTGTPDTLFGQVGGPAPNGAGFAGDTGNSDTSGPNGVTVAPNMPCIFATDGLSRVVSLNHNVS
jgi:hypothetical protein